MDALPLLLPFAAGLMGGAMNALAGGGTFATLPALIALGLPANSANATSNVSLLPGAAASAWEFRDELVPIGGVAIRLLAAITFVGALGGSLLLVLTPTHAFDLIIPWLLLFGFAVMAFGRRAAEWLHARVRRRLTPRGGARLDAVRHRRDHIDLLRACLRLNAVPHTI